MAASYTKNKDISLGQFRIYEGHFPDKLWSARQQYQNMYEIPNLIYLKDVRSRYDQNKNKMERWKW